MTRSSFVRLLAASLLLAVLAVPSPTVLRAEPGGPPEFAPGQSSVRGRAAGVRALRVQALRSLAGAQAAELDSLGALAAANPVEAARWQREIEAAKHRHAREEIALQREFAVRAGDAALVRRLAQRLERLELASGGAR